MKTIKFLKHAFREFLELNHKEIEPVKPYDNTGFENGKIQLLILEKRMQTTEILLTEINIDLETALNDDKSILAK